MHTQKMHTTTCCFHMSTPGGDGGMGDLRCARGERGLWQQWWWQKGWWCGGGNLTQSCVLGMTSLGGPVEVQCLGIVFAAGIGGRYGAEAEARMRPESLFYLACDGEIQINSCQSGGPQGEGLQWWGRTGLGVGLKVEIWWVTEGGVDVGEDGA